MNTCRRSRACYLAGCRNEPCRAANYRYMKRLQYDHARGQKRRTDATQTRVWIDRLAAHGWTRTQIADAAGTTPTTIRRITVGESRNISRSVAAGVLAIPLGRPDQGRINSTGTTRRLRALAVLGYPIYAIAEASRMDTSMLQGHLAAQHATIPAPIARRIATTYRRLSLTPGPSQISRTRAAARGWHGPAAWEDIDDPACEPEIDERPAGPGRPEQIDDERVRILVRNGHSNTQIAVRLGCSKRGVERSRSRTKQKETAA
ncbi:hypothetical protein AB0N46_31890 [Streptomyces albidoflavus]|uniref:hypothetical protein n=1 Tax=Streptomyces albidoflavus TaxID=1886 RepID=UPI00343536B0